jgi:hypothetical protein
MDEKMRQELKASRMQAGARIDPHTARVWWHWGQVLDPYGEFDDLPPEVDCVGRNYFARSPEPGSVWVSFCDLPKETLDVLWQRLERGDPGFDDDCPF